ncbi:MAG: CPBP family intramembrane metalloprotease [Lentimicrobiaceae bacterium]|nr:CPBP family intramembrane metalloprotease [Lentimicrobiaceae bacterium]
MKKRTTILTVIFIFTALALLWIRTYYVDAKFQLLRIFFLLLLLLLAIGATWFLYRREWHQVLGLNVKGITKKVIWKSFGVGLLINLICSPIAFVVYFMIFKEMPLSPLGELGDTFMIIPLILILAPLTEEFLFRGFIQGLWQKLYSDKEKTPIKLIIVVTALLFAISHFGFLFNITVKQFLITLIPLFIGALYLSWLRNKYQSIIPSIFAHFGFNATMIVAPIIALVFIAASPGKFREIKRQKEIAQYTNDTIPYNFDPNDMDEWQRSYKKFATLERPRSEEAVKHLKGIATSIQVCFTIDTCGNIYNVHVYEGTSSIFMKEYGYNYAEDAINVIKSLPQCKPYIVDGKKVEKKMSESVPLYPY